MTHLVSEPTTVHPRRRRTARTSAVTTRSRTLRYRLALPAGRAVAPTTPSAIGSIVTRESDQDFPISVDANQMALFIRYPLFFKISISKIHVRIFLTHVVMRLRQRSNIKYHFLCDDNVELSTQCYNY